MKVSISTKTGDTGTSGLANGQRLDKSDDVFEVLGTIDELNSWLGLIAVKLGTSAKKQRQTIYTIQDTLFYIGAEVARSPKAELSPHQLAALEAENEALQQQMTDSWHTQFVLPGGTELGAQLDIVRTVCRRCERVMVRYHHQQPLSPLILKYLNRLSDFLYMLRCYVNHQKKYQEKKFKPLKLSTDFYLGKQHNKKTRER